MPLTHIWSHSFLFFSSRVLSIRSTCQPLSNKTSFHGRHQAHFHWQIHHRHQLKENVTGDPRCSLGIDSLICFSFSKLVPLKISDEHGKQSSTTSDIPFRWHFHVAFTSLTVDITLTSALGSSTIVDPTFVDHCRSSNEDANERCGSRCQ